jgi:hypothetical protein
MTCASVVLPAPGGPLTTTRAGRVTCAVVGGRDRCRNSAARSGTASASKSGLRHHSSPHEAGRLCGPRPAANVEPLDRGHVDVIKSWNGHRAHGRPLRASAERLVSDWVGSVDGSDERHWTEQVSASGWVSMCWVRWHWIFCSAGRLEDRIRCDVSRETSSVAFEISAAQRRIAADLRVMCALPRFSFLILLSAGKLMIVGRERWCHEGIVVVTAARAPLGRSGAADPIEHHVRSDTPV